jgi:hypothetical protein
MPTFLGFESDVYFAPGALGAPGEGQAQVVEQVPDWARDPEPVPACQMKT